MNTTLDATAITFGPSGAMRAGVLTVQILCAIAVGLSVDARKLRRLFFSKLNADGPKKEAGHDDHRVRETLVSLVGSISVAMLLLPAAAIAIAKLVGLSALSTVGIVLVSICPISIESSLFAALSGTADVELSSVISCVSSVLALPVFAIALFWIPQLMATFPPVTRLDSIGLPFGDATLITATVCPLVVLFSLCSAFIVRRFLAWDLAVLRGVSRGAALSAVVIVKCVFLVNFSWYGGGGMAAVKAVGASVAFTVIANVLAAILAMVGRLQSEARTTVVLAIGRQAAGLGILAAMTSKEDWSAVREVALYEGISTIIGLGVATFERALWFKEEHRKRRVSDESKAIKRRRWAAKTIQRAWRRHRFVEGLARSRPERLRKIKARAEALAKRKAARRRRKPLPPVATGPKKPKEDLETPAPSTPGGDAEKKPATAAKHRKPRKAIDLEPIPLKKAPSDPSLAALEEGRARVPLGVSKAPPATAKRPSRTTKLEPITLKKSPSLDIAQVRGRAPLVVAKAEERVKERKKVVEPEKAPEVKPEASSSTSTMTSAPIDLTSTAGPSVIALVVSGTTRTTTTATGQQNAQS